jgi:hypothetical protein
MFKSETASPAMRRRKPLPHLELPRVDGTERFLLRLFLRRYITWVLSGRRHSQPFVLLVEGFGEIASIPEPATLALLPPRPHRTRFLASQE